MTAPPVAVILAGGLGTRLRSAIGELPKPMAPVHGRPFLEHRMALLARAGIVRFVLCVGYRREAITGYFGDGSRWGWSIGYSVEDTPLGTAGALARALPMIAGRCLVLNGDTWLDVDHRRLAEFHDEKVRTSGSAGTIVLAASPDPAASGRVAVDREDRILSFREKDAAAPGQALVNAGIYVFEEACMARLPRTVPASLEYDAIPAALAAGLPLFGFRSEGSLIDIGTPEGLERIRSAIRPA